MSTSAAPGSAEALLALALTVAEQAGELIMEAWPQVRGRRVVAGTKSSPTDVVTAADTAAELHIRATLLEARPGDEVVGEEGGATVGASTPSGTRWVVDPIDGTVNYLYGLPNFAVSIAAEDGEGALVGVVHAPAMGRTWAAVRGGGASCDGERLRVSEVQRIEEALVATGFGYRAERRLTQGAALARMLPKVRDVRRFGAASLDLCAVAGGQVDAYFERGLQRWDFAAGRLLVREAGGLVRGLDTEEPSESMLVASGPGISEPLRSLLRASGAQQGP